MVWGSPATAEKNQAIGRQRDFDTYFLPVEGEVFGGNDLGKSRG